MKQTRYYLSANLRPINEGVAVAMNAMNSLSVGGIIVFSDKDIYTDLSESEMENILWDEVGFLAKPYLKMSELERYSKEIDNCVMASRQGN